MRFTQVVPILLRSDRLQVGFYAADRTVTGSRTIRGRCLAQDKVTTGWPSLGWTTTKSGPWKVGWKDSPEPSPMREPNPKVLWICGCRFVG